MNSRLSILLAGGLLLVFATPVLAAPADVRVRVEGKDATLLERTAVRTATNPVNKDGVAGHDCTGTSAAGALETAVAGDWSGSFFSGLGYTVERIRGESHVFPEPDFFELWVNNRSLAVGICGIELQQGDDVLLFVARCEFDPITFACTNAPVLPLGLTVPASVAPGAPFAVKVVEYATDGTPSPVAGATVTGGDAPATTDGAGGATLTATAAGPRTLKATKAGRARSAGEPVCVTSGSDGRCGSALAGLDDTCRGSNGRDGRCGTPDRTAPASGIRGIAEGRRFGRGFGPRLLRAVVDPDPSGLLVVKLRLTRNDRGRCSTFSGRSERFRRVGCGARNGFWFGVGDRQDTSYLLPSRLPRGRYVLDVNAIDKAYNRDDARRRGANRVVFHVR